MNPLVSVIMPAYNVAGYIAESIESVQSQSFTNWELIIINDGSTDDTEGVVLPFLKTDSRIVYYKQINRGAAATRNQGLSLATGEIVAFLDGDDFWKPSFLEKLVHMQEITKADLVFSGYNRLLANGGIETPRNKLYEANGIIEGNIFFQAASGKVWMHIGSLIVRKEMLYRNDIRFSDGCLMWEDVEFQYKILTVANVAFVPETLMTYRQRPGSTTQQQWSWNKYIHSIYALERVLAYVKDNYCQENYAVVYAAFRNYLYYEKYRFLYRMIKTCNFEDALQLLYINGWEEAIRKVKSNDLGMLHKIKITIVRCKNMIIWQSIAKIWAIIMLLRRGYS